nr:MAG TPA: hypothetical protein [Caudoviricetes sp.]
MSRCYGVVTTGNQQRCPDEGSVQRPHGWGDRA